MFEAPAVRGLRMSLGRGVPLDYDIGDIILGHRAQPCGEVRKICRWVDASRAFQLTDNVQGGAHLSVPGPIAPPFARCLDIMGQLRSPTRWQGELDVGEG